jgi:hypothetical protein
VIAFICATYDIETGEETGHRDWACSPDARKGLFSAKERATLARGEFVEIEDEFEITRYAIKEERS